MDFYRIIEICYLFYYLILIILKLINKYQLKNIIQNNNSKLDTILNEIVSLYEKTDYIYFNCLEDIKKICEIKYNDNYL